MPADNSLNTITGTSIEVAENAIGDKTKDAIDFTKSLGGKKKSNLKEAKMKCMKQ
jgi:hypothetical protein